MIYQPAEDSELLARNLAPYVKGKSFLDMGTGSGVQSERAQTLKARSILAVDIDRASLSHVKSKGFNTIRSNLFTQVKGTFDVIAFNPPYLPRDSREAKESQRVTTGGKKGDEITLRFIRAFPKHLTSRGVVLIIVSSLTDPTRMEQALNQEGFVKRVIDTEKLFMETLELWELRRKGQ